jgi:hypothetical protein
MARHLMTARVALGTLGTLGLAATAACRSLDSGVGVGAPPSQPQASSTPVSQETSMTATQPTDGLPSDLVSVPPLWETRLEATRTRPLSITRLYEDGRVYTWSSTRRRMVGGQLRREASPYTWRLDAQLRTEGVDRVRDLIRAEFQQLPQSSALSPGLDQGLVTRRSHLDGLDYSVTLTSSATGDLPAVIQEIERAIATNVIPGAVPIDQ